MKLEQPTRSTYRLTLHAYELAALLAAARWAAEGGEGALPAEARQNLRQLVGEYEAALGRASRYESGPASA